MPTPPRAGLVAALKGSYIFCFIGTLNSFRGVQEAKWEL